MGQVSTRNVSLNSVLRVPAFRRGFNDYAAGKPPAFDEDWTGDRNKSPVDKAWAYERGRHFAAWLDGKDVDLAPGRKWFVNRRVNPAILRAAHEAVLSGAIR